MPIPSGEDLTLKSLARELIADPYVEKKGSTAYWIREHALAYHALTCDDTQWDASTIILSDDENDADVRNAINHAALDVMASCDTFSTSLTAGPYQLSRDPLSEFNNKMAHNESMLNERSRLCISTRRLASLVVSRIVEIAPETTD